MLLLVAWKHFMRTRVGFIAYPKPTEGSTPPLAEVPLHHSDPHGVKVLKPRPDEAFRQNGPDHVE